MPSTTGPNSSELKAQNEALAYQNIGSGFPSPPPSLSLLNGSGVSPANWSQTGCAVAGPNASDQNGNTLAYTITASAGAGGHFIRGNGTLWAAGTIFGVGAQGAILSVSINAKLGLNGANFLFLAMDQVTGNGQYFNLSTGVKGNVAGAILSSAMVSLGNGWYTLNCVAALNATTSLASGGSPQFMMSTTNGSSSFTAAGNETVLIYGPSVYLWPLQQNQGNGVNSSEDTTAKIAMNLNARLI